MEEVVTLKHVRGYYVFGSVDERSSSRLKGPFKDWNIASIECKEAGWYGSKGEIEATEFFEDENGFLHEVAKVPAKFVDEEKKFKEEMDRKIRAKLSQQEIDYLGLNK